jgi:hypothetical protein
MGKYDNPGNFNINRSGEGSKIIAARVHDIILDIDHEWADVYGSHDAIGTISFVPLNSKQAIRGEEFKYTAQPLFANIKNYPLINEIVLILNSVGENVYDTKSPSTYYISTLNVWNHPHHNALPPHIIDPNKGNLTSNDYQEAESGLVRRVMDGSTDINLGSYFNEKINLKPLLPYEGDIILEGRWGNSIRLGSTSLETKEIKGKKEPVIPEDNKNRWSNEGEFGDPITIIRNGQNPLESPEGWKQTVEDIDNDDSSIYLTSNQQLTDFVPASTNDQSYYANPILA